MAFKLELDFDDGGAVTKIKNVETGLNRATDATGKARDAMGRFAKGAGEAGAAGQKAGDDTAKGMARAKEAAEGHGDSLTRLIHLAEAYVAVHQIESIVDGYIEITNKTNSVATSQSNLNALMEEQFRIAQETRTPWEELAGAYQRIANASRGLGLSQRDVLAITEEISMGMRLSGASTREAAMTMMELTHAFNVGTLTGREYRVIAKDAPAFLHEIQVASGKTSAEFAEMGKHSKITAQLLTEWLGKAAPEIREKFAQMIPTISEGFTLIRNAAEKFFGAAGVGSGVVQTLGSAMKFVADHMDTLGKIVLGVGEALLSLFVIEKIIGLVKALTVAVAENPLGAILVAITAGIALLRQFGDEINTNQRIWSNVGDKFVTVGDQLAAVWEKIKDLGAAVIDFVDTAWHKLTGAFDNGVNGDGIKLSMRNVLTFIASFVDAAIGLFRFMNDTIVTIFGGLPQVISEAFVDMARAAVSVVETMVNKVIDAINAAVHAYKEVRSYLPGGGEGPDAEMKAKQRAAEQWAADMNRKYGFSGGGLNPLGIGGAQDDQARRQAGLQAALAAGLHPTAAGFTPGQAPGGYPHEGGIEPISLDFKNPFEGSKDAFFQKFKDDWKADIKNTSVTKDLVNSFMDDVDRIARDHAAKRVMDQKTGEVSTAKGAAEKAAESEKARKEAEAFANKLRTVTEEINPQEAAIEKLSHAHEIFQEAVRRTLINQDEAQRRYDLYAKKLEDQIHPFDAWIRKQQEATAVLRATSEEQERATKLQAFATDLKSKQGGVEATSAELDIARHQIEIDQKRVELMRAEQGVTSELIGPQHTYQVQLAAIGDLLEHGYLTADQYNRQLEKARVTYLATADGTRTFGELVEIAWQKAQVDARAAGVAVESYESVVKKVRVQQIAAGQEAKTMAGALEAAWIKARQDAEAFGATLATTLVGDVDKLNEALVSMANGGKVSFSDMVDSMIQDLEKLLLKQLEVMAVTAAINAFAPGAGSAAAASGGTGSAVDIANSAFGDLLGYATGGSWTVGGSGGTDSQLQMFRATPGERVTVTPPGGAGQYPMPSGSSGGGSGPPVVVAAAPVEIHNHYDESVILRTLDGPAARRIVVNHMRAEQSAVRSYSGTQR